MRLSTSLLYSAGTTTITNQQSNLQKLQQQISTGSRVLTPSDDPVAASQALEVNQAVTRNNQQKVNQDTANSALTNLDGQLGGIGDVIQYVRERVVQAGDGALSTSDKAAIASDIRAQFDALMNLANSKDATGEYLFSGFQGDTQPFTGTLSSGVTYQGDQGQRAIQVSNTRQISTSIDGDSLFQGVDSLPPRGDVSNSGTGSISLNVTGSGGWGAYGVKVVSATQVEVFDLSTDPTMSGGGTVQAYTAGIPFALPSGTASVTISGSPAIGDKFYVDEGGKSDVFSTFKSFVDALEGAPTGQSYSQVIADTLGRLDNFQDNVLKHQAKVGSEQVEIDALQSLGDDMKIQYADRLDKLVGVDYAQAISDFSLQKTYLEASQQSFVKITGLSLFNYLS